MDDVALNGTQLNDIVVSIIISWRSAENNSRSAELRWYPFSATLLWFLVVVPQPPSGDGPMDGRLWLGWLSHSCRRQSYRRRRRRLMGAAGLLLHGRVCCSHDRGSGISGQSLGWGKW